MSSPYKKFAVTFAENAQRRYPSTLEKGKMYPIYDVKKVKSHFKRDGQEYFNMLCYFKADGLNYYVYMPKNYDDPEQDIIDAFKRDISKGKPGSLCYYGTVETTNHLILHEHGEEVDEKMMVNIAKAEEMSSKNKRKRLDL